MTCPFTPDGYRTLIGRLVASGYLPVDFESVEPARRHLVLRHDVDQSLVAARALAEIEHRAGWTSHYFVMVRTEFYNPFSAEGSEAIRAVLDAGHRVGLHFDAALYQDHPDALDAGAARECALLESVTEQPVTVISLHRPAAVLRGTARPLAGRAHSYQPRFFSEIGYCSDSRGAWHHGDPLDHPAIREGRALQLLTHPIWWIGDEASPADRMAAFLQNRFRFLDGELARHCGSHRRLFPDEAETV